MPEYSEVPERVQKVLDAAHPDEQALEQRIARFSHVRPRAGDGEGDTEILDAVSFTHHFVDATGDYETVRWHYVECGRPDGEPIVFLHGIPASWFQWCHQMAALAATHRCIDDPAGPRQRHVAARVLRGRARLHPEREHGRGALHPGRPLLDAGEPG